MYSFNKNNKIQCHNLNEFIIKNNIKHTLVSKKLNKFKKLFSFYNLKTYSNVYNTNNNLLVFGLYNINDYNKFKNHKGKIFVMFGGEDCLNVELDKFQRLINLVSKNKGTEFISISSSIYNKLKKINISSNYVPLDFSDKILSKQTIDNKNIELYNDYLKKYQQMYTKETIKNIDFDTSINTNMKIVCVMCAYKREKLLDYVLNYLSRLDEIYKIIIVGSNNSEEEIVKKYDICEYHTYENLPLSNKWNKGVLEAKKHNPDGILIMGSDDIVSKDYLKYGKYLLFKNYDFIGTRTWYTVLKDEDTILDSAVIGYTKYRSKNEPIGAGRIISKRVLENVNWNLYKFNNPINSGLDANSYRINILKTKNLKSKIIPLTSEIYLMGIKNVIYENISVTHGKYFIDKKRGNSWYTWINNALNHFYIFHSDYYLQDINNINHFDFIM